MTNKEIKKAIANAAVNGMAKQAFSWSDVKNQIESVANKVHGAARDAWHSVPTEYKPLAGALVGAGGGALGGAALGSLTGLGAGRGALAGAGIGGIGGGLFGAHSMSKYLNADKQKAIKGKNKELADTTAAHSKELEAAKAKYLAELQGKNKELADATAAHRTALQDRDKQLVSLTDKYNALTGSYTPEKLAKLSDSERRKLLKAIAEAGQNLESSSTAIKDVNLRNMYARQGYTPEVIDRIMQSQTLKGRVRAQLEASKLREEARNADRATQEKINALLAEIKRLQESPSKNLLPGVYND